MSDDDPEEPTLSVSRSTMAPPYVDEDPELALVEEGLEEADSEIREAVNDAYEASARLGDSLEDDLDDIDYTAGDIDYATGVSESVSPEVAAIHEEFIPLDDEDE